MTDNTAKHTIVLPSGIKIDTATEISIKPDGSISFPGLTDAASTPAGAFVQQNQNDDELIDTESEIDRDELDKRGDGYVDGTLHSNDVLNLLSPPLTSNVYLRVIDTLLSMTDVHFDAVLTVYYSADPVSYHTMAADMGITPAAAGNRRVMIRRLGALQPADRYSEYWLDGVFADVLDEWQSEIEAERKRRSNIRRVYKTSHGGYEPEF